MKPVKLSWQPVLSFKSRVTLLNIAGRTEISDAARVFCIGLSGWLLPMAGLHVNE